MATDMILLLEMECNGISYHRIHELEKKKRVGQTEQVF